LTKRFLFKLLNSKFDDVIGMVSYFIIGN